MIQLDTLVLPSLTAQQKPVDMVQSASRIHEQSIGVDVSIDTSRLTMLVGGHDTVELASPTWSHAVPMGS